MMFKRTVLLPLFLPFPVCLPIVDRAPLLHIMRIQPNGRGKMSHRLKHRCRRRRRRRRHLLCAAAPPAFDLVRCQTPKVGAGSVN